MADVQNLTGLNQAAMEGETGGRQQQGNQTSNQSAGGGQQQSNQTSNQTSNQSTGGGQVRKYGRVIKAVLDH